MFSPPGPETPPARLILPLPLRKGRELSFGPLPVVMGILNVTPDSFSDGGRFARPEDAIREGLAMLAAGARILDVGGESTRPRGSAYGEGAPVLTAREESARVVPVLEGLRREAPHAVLSVDTRSAEVAETALVAGADLVNVVTGLEPEPALLAAVIAHDAALVLNHCRGTPQTTFAVSRFDDVVAEVRADLAAARILAETAGVPRHRIVLDPGLGFGKTAGENFALLSALDECVPEDAPLLVGASRKAFLGSVSGVPPKERLPESLAAVAVCARLAKRRPVIVRVHDVAESVRFLAVLEVLERSASGERG